MTRIAISAIMEDEAAADRLYDYVKEVTGVERLGIVDGSKVVAEVIPEDAGTVAETFAGFLNPRS